MHSFAFAWVRFQSGTSKRTCLCSSVDGDKPRSFSCVDMLFGSTHGEQSRTFFFFFFFCCCHVVDHSESVKRFVLLQFLNLRQSVGLLGRGISPSQGRYLAQTQNKHRHPCLEWDSNPRSQCSSGRRYFMPPRIL
jgi:hypothetical protein